MKKEDCFEINDVVEENASSLYDRFSVEYKKTIYAEKKWICHLASAWNICRIVILGILAIFGVWCLFNPSVRNGLINEIRILLNNIHT